MKSGACLVAFSLCSVLPVSGTASAADTARIRDADYVIQADDLLTAHIQVILTLGRVQTTKDGIVVDGYPLAVEYNGEVSFPLIGRIPLAGLTIEEAEKKVASICAEHHLFPGRFKYPVYFALLREANAPAKQGNRE